MDASGPGDPFGAKRQLTAESQGAQRWMNFCFPLRRIKNKIPKPFRLDILVKS